jgi:methyl-accepting chemotaxis protein
MGSDASRKKLPWWKRRFYVHKIQKTYAVWFGLFMFVSSLLVFGLALLVPFILPAVKLLSPTPLEERAIAATQLLSLVQMIVPALFFLVPATACFSIYITHRLAGPLYRIEHSVRELRNGNLALRTRLRKGDELQELADLLNEAVATMDQAIREIKMSEDHVGTTLIQIRDEMKKSPSANDRMLERLHHALEHRQRIDGVLKRFQFSHAEANT